MGQAANTGSMAPATRASGSTGTLQVVENLSMQMAVRIRENGKMAGRMATAYTQTSPVESCTMAPGTRDAWRVQALRCVKMAQNSKVTFKMARSAVQESKCGPRETPTTANGRITP